MHRADNRILHYGFLTVTVLLVVIGWYVYQAPIEKQQQGTAVVHTHEVLNQLDGLSNHLLDAETGQRGYILTGQAVYLSPFAQTRSSIECDLVRLLQLTSDNPIQQSRIPRLRYHISSRLDILKEAIDLRKNVSLAAARNIVVSGRGMEEMNAIREQINAMKAQEQFLLRQRMTIWLATERTHSNFLRTAILLYILLSSIYLVLVKHAVHRQRLFDLERQSGADHQIESERLAKVVAIQRDLACVRQGLQATMQTITERTREIVSADGSVVAMVEGDELVCRAYSGITAPVSGQRWNIAASLAGRCVTENAVLTCDDTETDLRADRTGSRRIGVRSVVAVPLCHNGHVIGVFTVVWSKVNAFTEQDVVTLELIAGALSAALSDAVGMDVLQNSEERLDEAQRTAHVGSWELDISLQKLTMSKEFSRMIGMPVEQRETNYATYRALYAPEDAACLDEHIQRAVREGVGYEREIQRTHTNETIPRWYHAIAKPKFDARGKVIGLSGTLMDITERKQADELLRENEARFRLLTEVVNDHAIFALDIQGRVTTWNAGAAHLKGYSAGEIIGTHFSIFYSAQDIDDGKPELLLEIAGKVGKYVEEGWRIRKDGEPFWANVTITAMRDKEGHLRGYSKVTRDLTERKKSEDLLRENEARMRSILDNAVDAIISMDEHGIVDRFNAAAESMFGYCAEEVLGRNIKLLMPNPCHGPHDDYVSIYRETGEKKVIGIGREVMAQRKNGTTFPADLAVGEVQFGDERRYTGFLRDITERKRIADALESQQASLLEVNARLTESVIRLEELATTDGLTGIKNHGTFQDRLKSECDRSVRYHSPLSLVLLDVDSFKDYNDTHGHPAGDAILKQVAGILMREARTTDIVARYGGEEFVLILPETGAMQARQIAERLRHAISSANWQGDEVTASFGVATLSERSPSASGLVRDADSAMYRSKFSGRNCVTHFKDALKVDVRDEAMSGPMRSLVQTGSADRGESLLSRTEQRQEEPYQSVEATMSSWSRILDMRDKETEGHSERVTEMMMRLARHLGLNEEETMFARWGAMVHDIGKIGVPDHILHKPGPLNDEEWVIMRQHTTLAYELLKPIKSLGPALDIPYCHHEKWDGSGYPCGLMGEEIPLLARMFAVIDVHDALTSERPYRKAWSEDSVRTHLRAQAGFHFDPHAVDAFLAIVEADRPVLTAA